MTYIEACEDGKFAHQVTIRDVAQIAICDPVSREGLGMNGTQFCRLYSTQHVDEKDNYYIEFKFSSHRDQDHRCKV